MTAEKRWEAAQLERRPAGDESLWLVFDAGGEGVDNISAVMLSRVNNRDCLNIARTIWRLGARHVSLAISGPWPPATDVRWAAERRKRRTKYPGAACNSPGRG
ncbi:MAG: hypothetical protein ACREU5_06805 [Burkholderiales bacterium]